ncbi:MAG: TonB-dependent receptor plug domain-containing protein, partial [Prevotella sp.]|nr:TonB-dependent receptor plug domain-containing protein [Prevotella sp.]
MTNKTVKQTTSLRRLFLVGILSTGLVPLCATSPYNTASAQSGQTAEQSDIKIVQGCVYEKSNGEILPGATISIYQGDKLFTGTVSDVDGKFKISIPNGDFEIRVSYLGLVTQTFSSKSKGLDKLNVFLESDSQTINDVVVTGFVNKNKESFTGSVTQIKGADLKMVSNTNIITAIAALTPGMAIVQNNSQGSNPNHVEELILRGTSSFSNSGQDVNQPTIILDGSEISMQDLYDLDMNEVESINVLKDASATALYGSKAANGVIVITRKPIKNSTLWVQYNFTGDLQFPMLGDYNVLNAADKLKYEQMAGLYDAQGAIDATTGLPLQY